MISTGEGLARDFFGNDIPQAETDDPRCEGCGRSLVTRFGGPVADAECPSCDDEFKRLARAGKIIDEEGNVVEFHFYDDAPDEANGEA
jgi:hypothetical protein